MKNFQKNPNTIWQRPISRQTPILPYASFYSKKFSDPPPFLAIFKKLNPPPSFMKGREACLNYVTLGQTEIY